MSRNNAYYSCTNQLTAVPLLVLQQPDPPCLNCNHVWWWFTNQLLPGMTIQLQLTLRIQGSLKKKKRSSAGQHILNLSVIYMDNHITIWIHLSMGKIITPQDLISIEMAQFSHLTNHALLFVVEPPTWNPDLVCDSIHVRVTCWGYLYIYIIYNKITDWWFQPSKKIIQMGSSPHYPELKIRKEWLKPRTR